MFFVSVVVLEHAGVHVHIGCNFQSFEETMSSGQGKSKSTSMAEEAEAERVGEWTHSLVVHVWHHPDMLPIAGET